MGKSNGVDLHLLHNRKTVPSESFFSFKNGCWACHVNSNRNEILWDNGKQRDVNGVASFMSPVQKTTSAHATTGASCSIGAVGG
jgi:hypothetical protein